jgi:hypothetical protein
MAKAHGFKSQKVALNLVEIESQSRRDTSSPGPLQPTVMLREYWVVPKGQIPAATDRVTPGRGHAYILRLNREAGTPTLARHQVNGSDVEVVVWNYQPRELIEQSELSPIFRASEDTFGELAIEPAKILSVKAPQGGIPARVGSQLESAICEITTTNDDDEAILTGEFVKVLNGQVAVVMSKGERTGKAAFELSDWKYHAIVDDCGDS